MNALKLGSNGIAAPALFATGHKNSEKTAAEQQPLRCFSSRGTAHGPGFLRKTRGRWL